MYINKIIEVIEKDLEIYEIFKFCPYEILKQWIVKKYKKGKFILNQGEVYDSFYIVVDGIINIYEMSENGKKYSLTFYKKGNFIGEHEIFDQKPFSCFVESITDVEILELKREYFLKWIELDRNINEHITKTLCRQFYKLSKKVGMDNLYTLRQRICQYMVNNIDNKISKGSFKINIKTANLSEQMAVTQRSVNRVLRNLKEENIIDIEGSFIVIKNLESLKYEADTSNY